jgi:hypothetical protein
MFEKVDKLVVLIRKGQAFIPSQVFSYRAHLFFKRGSGFVRLKVNNRTDDPKASWIEFSNGKIPNHNPVGYLQDSWMNRHNKTR